MPETNSYATYLTCTFHIVKLTNTRFQCLNFSRGTQTNSKTKVSSVNFSVTTGINTDVTRDREKTEFNVVALT